MYCKHQSENFSMKECLFWISLLTNNTNYFEWGSGSTTKIADKIAKSVISVEGSLEWYNIMKKNKFRKSTELVYKNIGPTKSFSTPLFSNMSDEYISHIKHTGKKDLILVDGRFRVACAISSYNRLSENGVLLFHDFHRKNYKDVLKIYYIYKRVESLVLLKPQKNVQSDRLVKIFNRYKTDYS